MNRTRTLVPASGRPALTCRRYASWLRPLSLLLALCCAWSFAGSGIAIAATHRDKAADKAAYRPFPHAPTFRAPSSAFNAAPAVLHSAPAWKLTQAAPAVRSHPTPPSESLLDEAETSLSMNLPGQEKSR